MLSWNSFCSFCHHSVNICLTDSNTMSCPECSLFSCFLSSIPPSYSLAWEMFLTLLFLSKFSLIVVTVSSWALWSSWCFAIFVITLTVLWNDQWVSSMFSLLLAVWFMKMLGWVLAHIYQHLQWTLPQSRNCFFKPAVQRPLIYQKYLFFLKSQC